MSKSTALFSNDKYCAKFCSFNVSASTPLAIACWQALTISRPDFNASELDQAIESFNHRDRRYGGRDE
jgi:hypothetical protein